MILRPGGDVRGRGNAPGGVEPRALSRRDIGGRFEPPRWWRAPTSYHRNSAWDLHPGHIVAVSLWPARWAHWFSEAGAPPPSLWATRFVRSRWSTRATSTTGP